MRARAQRSRDEVCDGWAAAAVVIVSCSRDAPPWAEVLQGAARRMRAVQLQLTSTIVHYSSAENWTTGAR